MEMRARPGSGVLESWVHLGPARTRLEAATSASAVQRLMFPPRSTAPAGRSTPGSGDRSRRRDRCQRDPGLESGSRRYDMRLALALVFGLSTSALAQAPNHQHYEKPAAADKPGPGGELAPRLQNLGVHTFKVSTKS